MSNLQFLNDKETFQLDDADLVRSLYFPIASEQGLKSVVTPDLGGDSKLNQNAFLLEPTSIENLHNNRSGRNFWCIFEDGSYYSAAGRSAEAEFNKYNKEKDKCSVTAGFMWHSLKRSSNKYGLDSKITSFVPYNDNVEIMFVEIKNAAASPLTFSPVAAIPVFGRSADNLRDHRHVTSLLHRIRTVDNGVLVRPTLSFDERGHQKNQLTYFVCGSTGKGNKPVSFYPTVDLFVGESGTYTNPEAVALNKEGVKAGQIFEGREAVGAIRFEKVTLKPGQTASYIILLGATDNEKEIDKAVKTYSKEKAVLSSLEATAEYWNKKVNISFKTGDENFDAYMRWVTFQPFLRRVYGCSFLPHHDYGKGGRGWRDLWQDCLALLMMDPDGVRQMILDNFGGVRADGTNATIIGSKQGEFIADRNGIARVWMDHGMWPFLTTKLYVEQSGDIELLKELSPYFVDPIVMRGTEINEKAKALRSSVLCGADGKPYEGSVIEHMILQHLCAICETGEHGIIKLRGADWNDALDMAAENGESVAFTCAYAGNLIELASYVRKLAEHMDVNYIPMMAELVDFVNALNAGADKEKSFKEFLNKVSYSFSGEYREIYADILANTLETIARDMMAHVRAQEWIEPKSGQGWYNSYYDNSKKRVEGIVDGNVRMMLTGQVFSIMSNTATADQVKQIAKSADTYLYDKAIGGYRLNTNFHEEKYDMGRAFGFAFGEKENGAVFSHMAVMYAYALYSRGFAKEGHKALQSLMDTAMDFDTSRIYPGIPEYFNNDGTGLYHYLTGAASWYVLTMVTQVFGIRGEMGRLLIQPKLLKEQFSEDGRAEVSLQFAGKDLKIVFLNPKKLEAGQYAAKTCTLDGKKVEINSDKSILIPRCFIEKLGDGVHEIIIDLERE